MNGKRLELAEQTGMPGGSAGVHWLVGAGQAAPLAHGEVYRLKQQNTIEEVEARE